MRNKKHSIIFPFLGLVALAALFLVGVYTTSATTIGTDIAVTGNLSVSGSSTLTGLATLGNI